MCAWVSAEKNEARKQFRHAKTSANDSHRIKELAQKFYRLVCLHSAEKRMLLKSKCRSEALKAMVDNTPVIGKQKLLLYRAGVCPRIMWDLTISHLSPT